MRYKLFGRSGLRVSELCIGTAVLDGSDPWCCDAATGLGILDAFAEAGGNFIDTANIYCGGNSERLVGRFIKADRDHFVVATKYSAAMAPDIVKAGNSRRNMIRSLEGSLQRMNTDYVDLFWLHMWDFTTPIEEIMRGFDDLVSSGKVLYIGISNAPAWQISRATMLAELRGWAPFIGLQTEYSLAERSAERDLLPMAEELGLGVAAFSTLAGGILTGKYLGSAENRPNYRSQPNSNQNRLAQLIMDIAHKNDCTPSQVALAAIRRLRAIPIIPIVGARNHAQLRDNLGVLTVSLSEDDLRELDTATSPELGVPHAQLSHASLRELVTRGHAAALDNHRAPG